MKSRLIWRVLLTCITLGVFGTPIRARAYVHSMHFIVDRNITFGGDPVVAVCLDTLAAKFPNLDRNAMLDRIRDAMTEWNRSGQSNVRLRYYGTVPSTDPGCRAYRPNDPNSPTIQYNSIYVTADDTALTCGALAQTPRWTQGSNILVGAQVVFYVSPGCGMANNNFAVRAPFDGDGSSDFGTTALHEFGHTLGMDHSTVPSAVMYSGQKVGAIRRRLMIDDIWGLRDDATNGYGRTPAQPIYVYQTGDSGQSWSPAVSAVVSTFRTPVDPGLCYQASHPSNMQSVIFAYVDASNDVISTLNTDLGSLYDSDINFDGNSKPQASSAMGLSVACNPYYAENVIAYGGEDYFNNGANTVNILTQFNHGLWNKYLAQDQAGNLIQSRNQPAVAFMQIPNNPSYILILMTTDVIYEDINFYAREPGMPAGTFKYLGHVYDPLVSANAKTAYKMGLSCNGGAGRCDFAFVDAFDPNDTTHFGTLYLSQGSTGYSYSMQVTASWLWNGGSLGVSLAQNPTRELWAWDARYQDNLPFLTMSGPNFLSKDRVYQSSLGTDNTPTVLNFPGTGWDSSYYATWSYVNITN